MSQSNELLDESPEMTIIEHADNASDTPIGDEEAGWNAPEIGLSYPDGELELARFSLPNGNVLSFFADPATGETGAEEIGNAGTSASFLADLTLSPLQRYLLITPEEVPVPELLVELESDPSVRASAGNRDTVAGLPPRDLTPLDYEERALTAADTSQRIVNDEWSCSNDTTAAFQDDFCVSVGGGSRVEYCASGTWLQLLQGPQKRDESYSVTTYCNPGAGSGGGRNWHEYRRHGICSSGFGFAWCQTGPTTGLTHNQWKWSHRSGGRHGRRVWHERTFYPNGVGHVRGYAVFFN